MKRNKRLLMKTAKRIETIPQSYDQTAFCDKSDNGPCGTTACLAGEMIICSERSVIKGIQKLVDLNDLRMVPNVAERLAGLTSQEADCLFDGGAREWPASFRNRYDRAKTQRGRANAAAALLRYVADGGKV